MLFKKAMNQLLEDHNVRKLLYNSRNDTKIFSGYGQHVFKRQMVGGLMHDLDLHLPVYVFFDWNSMSNKLPNSIARL